MLSVEDRRTVPLLETPALETNGEVSPDGRWLAYESNESGRVEIFVRPFPDVNRGRSVVSFDGGTRPRWSPDGHELFYLVPSDLNVRMMAAPVQTGTSFSAERARPLFEGPYFAGTRRPHLRCVLGWPTVSHDQESGIQRRALSPLTLCRRPQLAGRAEATCAGEMISHAIAPRPGGAPAHSSRNVMKIFGRMAAAER